MNVETVRARGNIERATRAIERRKETIAKDENRLEFLREACRVLGKWCDECEPRSATIPAKITKKVWAAHSELLLEERNFARAVERDTAQNLREIANDEAVIAENTATLARYEAIQAKHQADYEAKYGKDETTTN